ncbi:SDR family oxidoreductase [Geitlerinema sp. PCC 9228]|jgi:uncharacterized protein YbjT (DUF2867 family)|uniref:SDR family oxidoreductase n=1 Tax=Geitlerinema sp. PCC 9228 TaxID=111611 RepID=UPI0008F9A2E2|nr:SDR family oxidoreductase [Geitlerinema sp. PCC 9228]
MKVLVAGATGETGRRVVRELVEREIPVRAFVRNLETAQTILPPSAEIAVGDLLDRRSMQKAMAGCTAVISAIGARPSLDPGGPCRVDYEGTNNLVRVAQAQEIDRFVMVSSLCVSRFFHPLNLFWLVLFWKKRAEDFLRNSDLNYTIVRPGGLSNTDSDLPVKMSGADTLFGGSIPRSQVAKVCVEALFSPESQRKIVEVVATADASPKEISALFAGVS